MYEYIRWEDLAARLGDPTKWTAKAFAEVTNKGDPKLLPEPIEAPVAALKCMTNPKQMVVTLGEQALAFHGYSAQFRDTSPSLQSLTHVTVVHAEDPWYDGSMQRAGAVTICLELRHEERIRAEEERKRIEAEARRQREEKEGEERKAEEAAMAKEMASVLVPALERQLVGKRISAIGVELDAVVVICDDGTKLRIPCSSVECNDIEIRLDPDEPEVLKKK